MDAHITPAPAPAARPSLVRFALAGDERLAALAANGNERAFAALYDRYHQQLYRYCRSMVRSDADAQEALQSTFAGAFAALGRRRRDAPLRPWLYRIAHNESVSLLRRRHEHVELTVQTAGVSASSEERFLERERLARLVADLHALPERQRGALLMRELSGLSHEQIALALETSAGGAKQTIFEARRSLQEFAEGRAMSCEEVCRALSDGDRRTLRGRRVSAHVRSCAACGAFAAAMPARRADLSALAPPLPPALAGGMLAELLGRGGAAHGGAGTAAAGVAGKSVGLALATKAALGVALLAGATVGLSSTLRHHPSGTAPTRSNGAAVGAAPATPARSAGRAAAVGSRSSAARHTHAAGGRARAHAHRSPGAAGGVGPAGGGGGEAAAGAGPGRGIAQGPGRERIREAPRGAAHARPAPGGRERTHQAPRRAAAPGRAAPTPRPAASGGRSSKAPSEGAREAAAGESLRERP